MKIATFVSSRFPTPPKGNIVYAPMDVAVSLCLGLEKKGHQVTFFAPIGSEIAVSKVENAGLKPLDYKDFKLEGNDPANKLKIEMLYDQYLLSLMFRRAREGEFDILHIHPIDRALPLGLAFPEIPAVYTLHDQTVAWRAEIYRLFQSPNQHLVAISDFQKKQTPNLHFAGTVYNGIDLGRYLFSEINEDYLLFSGRLVAKKGAEDAIAAVNLAEEKLRILGVREDDNSYWDNQIKPNLGEKITFQGFTEIAGRVALYQKAKAAIFPFHWEEPFGLVMIEAMACGAPVIAYARGSVPEIIRDGVNGFIVNSSDDDKRGDWLVKKTGVPGLVEAIGRLNKMSRSEYSEMRFNNRQQVEKSFTIDRMVEGYDMIFKKILNISN